MCKYTVLKLSYPEAEKHFVPLTGLAVNTLKFSQCCVSVTHNMNFYCFADRASQYNVSN